MKLLCRQEISQSGSQLRLASFRATNKYLINYNKEWEIGGALSGLAGRFRQKEKEISVFGLITGKHRITRGL